MIINKKNLINAYYKHIRKINIAFTISLFLSAATGPGTLFAYVNFVLLELGFILALTKNIFQKRWLEVFLFFIMFSALLLLNFGIVKFNT